jgi:hypothetical protein
MPANQASGSGKHSAVAAEDGRQGLRAIKTAHFRHLAAGGWTAVRINWIGFAWRMV